MGGIIVPGTIVPIFLERAKNHKIIYRLKLARRRCFGTNLMPRMWSPSASDTGRSTWQSEVSDVQRRMVLSRIRQLTTRSPLHKFVIHSVKDAPATTGSPDQVGTTSTSAQADSQKAMIPSQRSDKPWPSPSALLSSLFGKAFINAFAEALDSSKVPSNHLTPRRQL
jgi:hypothetical protein